MNALQNLRRQLELNTNLEKSLTIRKYFKNSQDDIFLGIPAAIIRKIAKEFSDLELNNIQKLMKSNVHDERTVANVILCLKFKKGNEKEKEQIFKFYLKNKNLIRDWDSVDDTAPYILGPYLINIEKNILYELAVSKRIWDRRIAIVATLYFIRQGHLTDTIKIAEILLRDNEDLIHKAVGWMLREVGKKDIFTLKQFLNAHHKIMPRTMLRYAIERFTLEERRNYLIKTKE